MATCPIRSVSPYIIFGALMGPLTGLAARGHRVPFALAAGTMTLMEGMLARNIGEKQGDGLVYGDDAYPDGGEYGYDRWGLACFPGCIAIYICLYLHPTLFGW